MNKTLVVMLTCASFVACNGTKKPTPEEEAAEAKANAKELKKAKKKLKALAALEDKVKDLAAKSDMDRKVLEGTRNGYANFDVLLVDELADPPEISHPRILLEHSFDKCAKAVAAKKVYATSCSTRYVVVLRPRTLKLAKVSGDSYSPGKIDADAFVFDLEDDDGALLGGGHVVATTPSSASVKGNAEYELSEKLGENTFDALAEALHVKK